MGLRAPGWANAEARRSLDTVSFTQNQVRTLQLPRDTVIKRMIVNLIASFDVTYASGSPLLSELGLFESICPQLDVIVNSNRTVKSVSPHMQRMHATLFRGQAPRRAYETNSSAIARTVAGREWVNGQPAYPATTEFFLINESIPLSFELPDEISYKGDKSLTSLDIRDVASADLKFYFTQLNNVLNFGNAAAVTYGNQLVSFNTQIVEDRARPRPEAGAIMFDYVESFFRRTYTGESKNQIIEIPTGNFVIGLGLSVRNGDANRRLADNLLKGIELKVNGSTGIQGPVDFSDLQADNKERYGIHDMRAGSNHGASYAATALDHSLRGFAYMNLINGGNVLQSGINTSREALVDSLKLYLNTNASSGTDAATYTNPVEVTVQTHEIRPFAFAR